MDIKWGGVLIIWLQVPTSLFLPPLSPNVAVTTASNLYIILQRGGGKVAKVWVIDWKTVLKYKYFWGVDCVLFKQTKSYFILTWFTCYEIYTQLMFSFRLCQRTVLKQIRLWGSYQHYLIYSQHHMPGICLCLTFKAGIFEHSSNQMLNYKIACYFKNLLIPETDLTFLISTAGTYYPV